MSLEEQYRTDANLNARIALHARFSTNPGWSQWLFDHEAPPGFSQRRPDGRRTIGRHALVKMRDAIGTVAVTEHQSMTERHLPAYGIGGQIDPGTFADFPVRIVSNLGTETADRNDSIHGVLPRAWGPILDACPASRPVTDPCDPVDEASFVV